MVCVLCTYSYLDADDGLTGKRAAADQNETNPPDHSHESVVRGESFLPLALLLANITERQEGEQEATVAAGHHNISLSFYYSSNSS